MTETLINKEIKEEPVYVDGMSVDLLEDCVRVHLGKGFTKLISYEEFVGSLSGLLNKDKPAGSSVKYFLPPGAFYVSIGDVSIEISCYFPECYRNIVYKNGSENSLTRLSVIPNIIIGHSLKKNKGNVWTVGEPRYYSTAKSLGELERKAYLSPSADLYLMPFTNTYADGRLCYGANSRTQSVTLPELRPLHWYYEILFTAPFNNDLGVTALRQPPGGPFISSSDWYKILADVAEEKGKFPYDKLKFIERY